MAANKGIKPSQREEDLALALDLRKRFESRFQVRQRQLGLVPVVEGPKTLLDPVLGTRRVAEIVLEIMLLGSRVRAGRLSHVGVFLAVPAVIALLFRGEEGFRV